jgi:hypothetical protein
MKEAILTGPVVGMMRYMQIFVIIKKAFYKHLTGIISRSAILLIGWDDSQNCWIAKIPGL